MWKNKFFLFFVLNLLINNVFTQAYLPPLRIEIEVPSSEFPFQVIPLEENGVALLYETDVIENKQKKWNIILFDTNLQKLTTTDIWLERNMDVKVINSDNDNFYICFQKFDRRTTIYNTYIVHYFIANKKTKVYAFNVREKENIFDIYLIDSTVFYASVFNHQEEVFVMNLNTLQSVPLYSEKTDKVALFHFFQFDTINNTLWTASTLYTNKTTPMLHLMQLNTNGTVLQNSNIPFENDYYLNFCKMRIIDKNTQLLTGSYINKNELSASKNNDIINSGIYSIVISNGNIEKSNYFNFVLLSSQIGKEKSAFVEKKDISLNLQLLMNEIAQNDSFCVFIGEVFYPEYRQEYAANYGMYGYTSAPTTVFTGYRYQIAYVLAFNNNGELIWNTQFQYNDVSVKSLKNILHAYIDDNNDVVLFYASRGEVISVVLNSNTVKTTESIPIELLSPADRIIAHHSSTFKHWYSNYFIYYGYQTISGAKINKKYSKKRHVLFVNKLVYR